MQILARNRWTRAYAPATYCRYMPKMLPHRRGVVLSLAAALITQGALAQVEPLGSEYTISGPLAGDLGRERREPGRHPRDEARLDD